VIGSHPGRHAAPRRGTCRQGPAAPLLPILLAGLLAGCVQTSHVPPPEAGAGPATFGNRLAAPAVFSGGDTGSPIQLTSGAASNRPVGPPEIIVGNGRLVNLSGSPGSPPAVAAGSDVSLDFTSVDIRDVLKSVLGNLLQVPYTIDPAVQGTMTLQTGKPIPRSAVIDVLSTTLQLNGVALVARNGMYLAVPIANAARQAPLGGTTGFVTQVVPLQYVTSADLERALEPLIPPGSTVKSDPERNILIVSGPAGDVAGIVNNIAAFDVDVLRGLSFALLPLQNGRAADVANDVTNLLKASGRTMADMVKVTPIDRMNAILVTSMQPAYLRQVRSWVERFDRGVGGSEQRLFIYRVQNGRATDLARVLRRALGIETTEGGAGGTGGFEAPPAAAPAAFSTGPESAQSPASGNQSVNATEPAATQPGTNPLASVSAAAALAGGTAPAVSDIRVTADPSNNALIITATPQEYAPIEAALEQLDVTPLQVLVDATIAEVDLSGELDLGLSYFFNSGRFHAISAPGTAPAATLAPTPNTGGFFPGFPGTGFLQGLNIAYGSADKNVILQVLSSITTVHVLSSPNLLVRNNGTARLQVGDQVPIETQSAVSTVTSTPQIVNSIAYKDTGVILTVTPRVNAGGLVLLDISEEVSTPTITSTSSITSPTISQRRVTSSVAVNDGQTIGLAGLITDNKQHITEGIPFLQNLPLLGFLFRATTDTRSRTEVLVLITPHVIRNREEGDAITQELREKLRQTIPLVVRMR
jgi:general secretion pathway protein D